METKKKYEFLIQGQLLLHNSFFFFLSVRVCRHIFYEYNGTPICPFRLVYGRVEWGRKKYRSTTSFMFEKKNDDFAPISSSSNFSVSSSIVPFISYNNSAFCRLYLSPLLYTGVCVCLYSIMAYRAIRL